MTADMVNHPPHYTSHPAGIECIDVIEHWPCNVANAVKYLWRAGLKGDAVEDLRKAAWYVQREIDRQTRHADRDSHSARDRHDDGSPAPEQHQSSTPPVDTQQPLVIFHDEHQAREPFGFRLPPRTPP